MPDKAKKLKSLYKTIEESLEKYVYEKVKAATIYLANQKKLTSPRAYFLKILENNWAVDISEIKEVRKQEKDKLSLETNFKLNEKNDEAKRELLFFEFQKSPIDIQNGIESYVYREYINICGMETKIQQLVFLGSRKKLICDYLEEYPQIVSFNEKVEKSIEKLKNYIKEFVVLYEDLVDKKLESLEEVKKRIILDCMTLFFP